MNTSNQINWQQKSFARIEDAQALSTLLTHETGLPYVVRKDRHLGFTAIRQANTSHSFPHERYQFSQAWRGFIGDYLRLGIGFCLMIQPEYLQLLVLDRMNVSGFPLESTYPELSEGVFITGLAIALYSLRFVYRYFALKLWFDQDGVVLKTGIIAQQQVQIRYTDIKTISVKQTIIDRLLGIGTIHLDSAGTNGTVDIVFDNLLNPVELRVRLQQWIDGRAHR